MTVETRREKFYTVDQYMKMADNGKDYELVEGKLTEMPGPNLAHGRITKRLFRNLDTFLIKSPIGEVLDNVAFELDPKNALRPDLAFISAERGANNDESKAFPGAPDLAIEAMSPTDKWRDVSDKVRRYLHAGARMVWVVDPFDQGVTVYRPDQPRRLLLPEDELDGLDVVPGFKLLVGQLFG